MVHILRKAYARMSCRYLTLSSCWPINRGVKTEKSDTELMTEGSIWKKILLFSIPLILGNLLQQLYNTADSIIVGNFTGRNALAAVGSSTSLINLLIAFSMGAATGAGVIIAQHLGARDRKSVEKAVHTSLAIALILGLVLTICGIIFSRALLVWMKTPEEVLPDSITYLQIYSGGLIFNVLYNMAAGILNAAGNSKRSLLYLAAASVTNIVLDLIFIAIFDMGVAGAAIATDISQLVSSVLALRFLLKVDADYRVSLRLIRVDGSTTRRIVSIGLPTGIQNMVISFSNMLVQSSVNSFGAAAMAGFGAYMKIDGFNILPILSFSLAVTTFIGQNYGAGNLKRVKQGAVITVAMGMIYAIITGILILTFAYPLVGLFSSDPEVIEYGVETMRYLCPFYAILSVMHILAGAVRGTGRTVPPMVILLVSLCLFRIFWVYLILPHIGTIDGVFILYPISWAVGATLMLIYTLKGSWLK